MSELLTLLKCLPAILGLIKAIEKGIEEAKNEQEVKDVVNQVAAAFNAKDSTQLNNLFNK
jgi:DNA-binding FrmR family transcriptional regulator